MQRSDVNKQINDINVKLADLKKRLDEAHQDILDLRGDLEFAMKLTQPLELNTKYQMEMGRVEKRLKAIEKSLWIKI